MRDFLLPVLLSSLLPVLLYSLLPFLIAGCANPVPPSGGPEDRTPPRIVASDPAEGAVSVRPDRLRLEFSEYVDRSAFEQAVRVIPGFNERLRFDWGRRAVDVIFPGELRENTTYRVTLETSFQDVQGVTISEPITIAFATGPRINRGRLAGRVIQADTGRPAANAYIYAYSVGPQADSLRTSPDSLSPPRGVVPPGPNFLPAQSDSLPPQPDYRTQTGPDGTFMFTYLREQPYYVIALADNNRNQQRDRSESFAVPPQPALDADTTEALARPLWWLGLPGDGPAPPRAAPDTSRAGAAASAPQAAFGPAHFVRDSVIWLTPQQRPYLTLRPAVPAVDTARLDTSITVRDTSGAARTHRLELIEARSDSTTYALSFSPPLSPGAVAIAEVNWRGSTARQAYARYPSEELGGLVGVIDNSGATIGGPPAIAQLYIRRDGDRLQPIRTVEVGPDNKFRFRYLPDEPYRLRVFVDEDGDSTWDVGRLAPYAPREPITWLSDTLRVRPRWETTLGDTLAL